MKKTSESLNLTEMMTVEQVATVLSISTRTVRRMLEEGLESMKFRRRRYIHKSALINYINTNKAS